ncbi:MAG TPA: rhodanese-like domain-containing protein [Candidatus Fimimorpha excrementavium]|nr:rhodanese-like domain-containing protein [Candidatus Fimimorpha excrementavium]
MGMWNILTGKNNFMKGIEQFQNTPGAVLLDVRTREEYNERHVPGSVNLPLSELEQISYAKTTPLFVYCHSGARSSQACRYLKQKGYQAENIGGIVSYRGAFG